MKRHESLHPLSQHHHFALIQALEMRRAAEKPGATPAAIERQASKFVAFWHKTGLLHFREEEEILLPAYARYFRVDQDAEMMRMLADHAEIRAIVRQFEEQLAAKQPIEAASLGHLARLLHDHVRLEENEIFPRIEKILDEKSLNAMGQSLTRLHPKGAACEV